MHPDLWAKEDQHRFEDRVSKSIDDLRKDVDTLTTRIVQITAIAALLAFLIPIVAPFIRGWLQTLP